MDKKKELSYERIRNSQISRIKLKVEKIRRTLVHELSSLPKNTTLREINLRKNAFNTFSNKINKMLESKYKNEPVEVQRR